MADPLTLALVVVAGVVAGVASGLFGVGGGVLMVPAALYATGASFHEAKAASLVVICASAGVGILAHHRKRSVDFRRGLLLALGGALGTLASVLVVETVTDRTLRLAFALLLAATGVRLALRAQPRARALTPRAEAALLLCGGLLGGVLAGAFGIGGGVLMVPLMVFAGVGMHLAVGTSLVAVLGNAVAGTAAHLALDYGPTLVAIGLPLALGAVPGTHVGSVLAHRLHADRLRRIFGAFLVLVSGVLAIDALT